METPLLVFEVRHGYASLKELKRQGIHTQTIRRLLNDGAIEKVKPGLYRIADLPVLSSQGMIEVCLAMPKAVVCLHSALSYYDLTTRQPSAIMIALPRASKPAKLPYPPTQIFYFSPQNHGVGSETVQTRAGSFAIYNMEKTVVDCFRYRHKLGMEVALEGLKNYLRLRQCNLNALLKYAKHGRMLRVMKPYLEAITG